MVRIAAAPGRVLLLLLPALLLAGCDLGPRIVQKKDDPVPLPGSVDPEGRGEDRLMGGRAPTTAAAASDIKGLDGTWAVDRSACGSASWRFSERRVELGSDNVCTLTFGQEVADGTLPAEAVCRGGRQSETERWEVRRVGSGAEEWMAVTRTAADGAPRMEMLRRCRPG